MIFSKLQCFLNEFSLPTLFRAKKNKTKALSELHWQEALLFQSAHSSLCDAAKETWRQRFCVMTELQTWGSSKPSAPCTVTCPRCWHSSYTLRSIRLTINTGVNEVSAHKANLRLRLALRTKDSFIKHYEYMYMMFYYDSSTTWQFLVFFLFMWAYAYRLALATFSCLSLLWNLWLKPSHLFYCLSFFFFPVLNLLF